MSNQYRLVQSVKTASGGWSAGPMFVRAVAPRIYLYIYFKLKQYHNTGSDDLGGEEV
jgi:hypothetical protein